MAQEFAPPFDRSKALSFDSEHLLRTENIPFDIDNWYPALRHWTFESHFLPLTRPQARAIVRYYRHRFLRRTSCRLNWADTRALQQLEDRLDGAIRTHFPAEGCFVRLCGRSAKDGDPLHRDRVRREYEAALQHVGPSASAAERMRAAAKVPLLRARSGPEVMNLLLTSERVYSDMLDWLWYGEPEQVVLRRWEPEVSVDMEFRLYVSKNSLNAMSQYDHHCRYEHLFSLKEPLLHRMAKLWSEVHPHVGAASYAMDMVYLPQSDRLKVVELSPFLRCTGAHCFRWERAEDVEVLEGRRPFEFRLTEQPSEDFDSMFCTGWEERWYRGEDPPAYWLFYQTPAERWATLQFSRICRWLAVLVLGSGLLGLVMLLQGNSVMPLAVLCSLVACCSAVACALARRKRRRAEVQLFVYGTLKRGMHWNSKFLKHGASFLSIARTVERFPLVVGRCGVPYLLVDQQGCGHHVVGELWSVEADVLEGLDQYEGLDKGYYVRPCVQVLAGGRRITAQVYAVQSSPPALRELPSIEEYTHSLHNERYRAVEHILLKQQLYLQGFKQYSTRDRIHPPRDIQEDAGLEPRSYDPCGQWAMGPGP